MKISKKTQFAIGLLASATNVLATGSLEAFPTSGKFFYSEAFYDPFVLN